MATLKDVATTAGVSVATVSRFLNGTLDLPPRTVGLIETAIRKLRYVPNPHARRLSLGRSDTIGLVVPDIATPFFSKLVAAVEQEADRRGLSLSLHATLNSADREMLYLDTIRRHHVDGLIFVTNHAGSPALAQAVNASGKVVVLDEDVPGSTVPKLFCDNEHGGYLAGAHLAAAGHRHVLFAGGGDDLLSGRRRYRGCLRAFREIAGEGVTVERVAGPYTLETGREAARRLLASTPRPGCVFAASDDVLIGMLEVLMESEIVIPDDLSIVSFDDVGPLHLFAPPITAVRQPVRELGARALALLLDTDWDDDQRAPGEALLPVKLIERKSVAPPVRPPSRGTQQ